MSGRARKNTNFKFYWEINTLNKYGKFKIKSKYTIKLSFLLNKWVFIAIKFELWDLFFKEPQRRRDRRGKKEREFHELFNISMYTL